jgi:mRNA interferase RelE/StbE
LTYNLLFKQSAKKDLEKLPKHIAQRILKKIQETLLKSPYSFPLLKGRFEGLRKLKVGKYRVVYQLSNQDIFIVYIDHRKDVYR